MDVWDGRGLQIQGLFECKEETMKILIILDRVYQESYMPFFLLTAPTVSSHKMLPKNLR